jgi:hypothetical protein
MSKLYRFIGVSRGLDGVLAVRWANELGRARHLQRVGHTDVRFWDMGAAEHKMECMDQMLNLLEESATDFSSEEALVLYKEADAMGFRLTVTI